MLRHVNSAGHCMWQRGARMLHSVSAYLLLLHKLTFAHPHMPSATTAFSCIAVRSMLTTRASQP